MECADELGTKVAASQKGPLMGEIDPDEELRDPVLEEEIELLGQLLAAVTEAGRPLGADELDRALGVDGSGNDDASLA